MDFLSAPIITLSFAYSSCSMPTSFFAVLAATRAASLTKLAKSAPEKPGVPLAMKDASTSSAIGTFFI